MSTGKLVTALSLSFKRLGKYGEFFTTHRTLFTVNDVVLRIISIYLIIKNYNRQVSSQGALFNPGPALYHITIPIC